MTFLVEFRLGIHFKMLAAQTLPQNLMILHNRNAAQYMLQQHALTLLISRILPEPRGLSLLSSPKGYGED